MINNSEAIAMIKPMLPEWLKPKKVDGKMEKCKCGKIIWGCEVINFDDDGNEIKHQRYLQSIDDETGMVYTMKTCGGCAIEATDRRLKEKIYQKSCEYENYSQMAAEEAQSKPQKRGKF